MARRKEGSEGTKVKQIAFVVKPEEDDTLGKWAAKQSITSDAMRYLVEKNVAEQIAKYGEVRDVCEEIPRKRNMDKLIEIERQKLEGKQPQSTFNHGVFNEPPLTNTNNRVLNDKEPSLNSSEERYETDDFTEVSTSKVVESQEDKKQHVENSSQNQDNHSKVEEENINTEEEEKEDIIGSDDLEAFRGL